MTFPHVFRRFLGLITDRGIPRVTIGGEAMADDAESHRWQ